MSVEIPSIQEFWQSCDCERRAKDFITSRSQGGRLVDPDDFCQELWLHCVDKISKFDIQRGKESKTVDEKFVSWFYWQMASVKTKMIRQNLEHRRHGFMIVEIDAPNSEDGEEEESDYVVGLDNYLFKVWLAAEFSIPVEEIDELENILTVINNVIESFGSSKAKMLQDQAKVLKCLLDTIRECGERPDLTLISKKLEMSYHATSRAYEAALRQVKYKLTTLKPTGIPVS